MSPPTSSLFRVQEIPDAGRGVVATAPIANKTLILTSSPPASHVIFRQYRKEVCAQCFHYELGRSLPVRDGAVGKVFCTPECKVEWTREQGELGLEAWRAVQAVLQTKKKGGSIDEVISDSGDSGERPGKAAIDMKWAEVTAVVYELQEAAGASGGGERENAIRERVGGKLRGGKDPDLLGFFLQAILSRHNAPAEWDLNLYSLIRDEEPYKSMKDLEVHCNAYLRLVLGLPIPLLLTLPVNMCRTLIEAGSHNAFGMCSGGEDLEEYMGYGVYPEASYFNHSCNPNIIKERSGRIWEIRASRGIDEGEECCITYMGGDEKDLGVVPRRERLNKGWKFKCACERCTREASETCT